MANGEYHDRERTHRTDISGEGLSMLVVDDNEILRDRLARAFINRGFLVRTAAGFEQAIEQASQEPPDMAVIDLRMPGRTGLELLKELKAIHPSTKVVMLTGFGSISTAVEAMRLGATNFLPKPADADDVLAAFTRGDSESATLPDGYQPPSLARAEWEHINRVLADCGGNISEAARRLGIHRRSLQRKLHKLAPE